MTSITKAASLHFDQIYYTYPGNRFPAIDNVSFKANPGELLVLVGPSGCGKSTILRIAAGLLFPEAGHLFIDAEDALKLSAEKRRIGWVPQSYALFEHMNIAENVGFGLKMQKVPKLEREERVCNMLKLCRIEELAKRSVRALSGGQRQRVAIARALVISPRALLLDEPLAALDPQLRIAIRADLVELLRESGVTTLFVTHDQSEALAIADKIVVLRNGKVEQIGTSNELWNHPKNEFVAEFLSNAIIVKAMAINERMVELAGTLKCSLNVPVEKGRQITLALRKDNFEIGPEGVQGIILYSEYNGGEYQLKVKVHEDTIIPVSTVEELPIGAKVLVRFKDKSELTVVGS